MSTPIIFKLTDAGRQAALDAQNTGLNLQLTEIGLGSGKYVPDGTEVALTTPIGRWPLSGGDIEPNSKTLRFYASIDATINADGFEVGLFDANGVLFAVASTTGADPLMVLSANITFVATFGLSLTDLSSSNVTVVTDPNAPLALTLMAQHLAATNPHPQYADKAQYDSHVSAYNAHVIQNDLEHSNLAVLIANVLTALNTHQSALDPHPQYLMKTGFNPRHLFVFKHNDGTAYSTSSGSAEFTVSHAMVGPIKSLGNCLNDYDPILVNPVSDYVVAGITLGGQINKQGFFLGFDGYIQCGAYAGQGDTNFGSFSAKIRFLDQNDELLVDVPLDLTKVEGNFLNNGNVSHVTFHATKEMAICDLRRTAYSNSIPTTLKAQLLFNGTSDSDGGSADLQILTVEGFSIICKY